MQVDRCTRQRSARKFPLEKKKKTSSMSNTRTTTTALFIGDVKQMFLSPDRLSSFFSSVLFSGFEHVLNTPAVIYTLVYTWNTPQTKVFITGPFQVQRHRLRGRSPRRAHQPS